MMSNCLTFTGSPPLLFSVSLSPSTPQIPIPGGEDPPCLSDTVLVSVLLLCRRRLEVNLLAKPGNSSSNSAIYRQTSD